MSRLSKEDWIYKGLNLLSTVGEDAIRVDTLCKELDVSKGSFYHHFDNVEAYVQELMRQWEKEATADVIEDTEQEQGLVKKMERLDAIVIAKDHLLEVRLRGWALRNTIVKHHIAQVDKRRMDYLTNLYQQADVEIGMARDLSRIIYANLVGAQQLFHDMPVQKKGEMARLFNELIKQFLINEHKKQ